MFQFNGIAGKRPRRESAPWLSLAGARVPGGRKLKCREALRKESGLKLVGNGVTGGAECSDSWISFNRKLLQHRFHDNCAIMTSTLSFIGS